jgi:3alpha(or 20beta)-hydroxysteroid dehydrogenase
MVRLADKVVVITGAASGQGEFEARLFVAEGARVVLTDVNTKVGQNLAQELGPRTLFQPLDVTDEAAWAAAVDAALTRFGKVDALLNNAGLFRPKPLSETTVEEWDAHYRVNQLGVFLGMRAVMEPMIAAGGGSIVNTSSAAALRGNTGMFAYAATKWAVRGMSKAAALDLAKHNVRVNCVLPGIIDTPMYRSNGPERCAQMDQLVPIGRRGQPEDVAELMAFLVSPAGSYFVGAEFTIDGGVVT